MIQEYIEELKIAEIKPHLAALCEKTLVDTNSLEVIKLYESERNGVRFHWLGYVSQDIADNNFQSPVVKNFKKKFILAREEWGIEENIRNATQEDGSILYLGIDLAHVELYSKAIETCGLNSVLKVSVGAHKAKVCFVDRTAYFSFKDSMTFFTDVIEAFGKIHRSQELFQKKVLTFQKVSAS